MDEHQGSSIDLERERCPLPLGRSRQLSAVCCLLSILIVLSKKVVMFWPMIILLSIYDMSLLNNVIQYSASYR